MGRDESRFFRPPGFYRALRSAAVPLLRTYPRVRVWHPGCGSGEEVYSTAIVLFEEGLLERCQIYATDEDPDLLAQTRRGAYAEEALLSAEGRYAAAGGRRALADYYLCRDGAAEMASVLRQHVTFAEHSLATDASPNEFQLIVYRDALHRLDPQVAERACQLFHESLCRLGYLGLMQGGAPHDPHGDCYRQIAQPESLYRRTC